MTDPKNTEDQELSLDQLKAAAGGSKYINDAGTQGSLKQTGGGILDGVISGEKGNGIQEEWYDTGPYKQSLFISSATTKPR